MRMRSSTSALSRHLSGSFFRQSPIRSWSHRRPHGRIWPTSSSQLKLRATSQEGGPVNPSIRPAPSGQTNPRPTVSIISSELASKGFSIFSMSSAALGLGAIVAPGVLIALVLPGAEAGAMDETLLRLAGATMAISYVAEFCLKASVIIPPVPPALSGRGLRQGGVKLGTGAS
jgi:hypothetical protein